MTGDEWLEQIFAPALRTGRPPVDQLRGALRVLAECEMLSQEAIAGAEQQLDRVDGERSALSRRRHESLLASPPGSRAGVPHERLEGILAPACELGDVDGLTVVLVLVELWTSKSFLRVEALRNALTDELDRKYEAAWARWEASKREHGGKDEPPEQPGERLLELPLSVCDDIDTHFHSLGRSAGGEETPWRSEWRFEPGVPRAASRLTIALEGAEAERQSVELALPDRR